MILFPSFASGRTSFIYGVVFLISLLPVSGQMDPAKFFGTSEETEGALIGIFYDFKQSQDGEPTGLTDREYNGVVADFVDSGWREDSLDTYFRAAKPMYATQLWVPSISAGAAPKAFGVEDFVSPTRWMVHYKGQVRAPKKGVFRFVGYADNVVAVAVNSETVLIGYIRGSEIKSTTWTAGERLKVEMPAEKASEAFTGTWFSVEGGEVIDLDILFGERPGGQCFAFLMLEEAGVDYPRNGEGEIRLPPFQLEGNGLTSAYKNALPWNSVP